MQLQIVKKFVVTYQICLDKFFLKENPKVTQIDI